MKDLLCKMHIFGVRRGPCRGHLGAMLGSSWHLQSILTSLIIILTTKVDMMAQDGPKMAQDGPKMAPRWPKMAPRWPQDGPKMAQDGSRVAKIGPRPTLKNIEKPMVFIVFWGSGSPRMGRGWAPGRPTSGHISVDRAILGHYGAILGVSWAFLGPSWGHLGPSWGHLGPS